MTWTAGAILVPLIAACLSILSSTRRMPWVIALGCGAILLPVSGLTHHVWVHGPFRYPLGGWGAPLGIDWYADGLSVLLVIMSTTVMIPTSVYAWHYLNHQWKTADTGSGRMTVTHKRFWPLWFFLWASLHALFLSADLFNLYVTLELLSLSGAMLMTLTNRSGALIAGMRYLLVSFFGSLMYLLSVGLLYATYGTLDLAALSRVITSGPHTWIPMTLMTVGLLFKTGLFPLHGWLPPAQANALSPVSAILSGLVEKAPFYLILRLWFQVFDPHVSPSAGQLLGVLGAGAIVWGSLQAFRQERLKLLVAYSTVAQIGYLFLLFPLTEMASVAETAWSGGIYHALAHGFAKASMFLAAGNIMLALGHDRLSELDGIAQALPMSLFAFGLSGISLMGLPPSGGFVAKWLLLTAAWEGEYWWWAGIILGGGLLTAGYTFIVLKRAFATPTTHTTIQSVPFSMECAPLLLAVFAILLGLTATFPLSLLHIGNPFPLTSMTGIR
ncbi:MAG: proton-conducting transporter membrane subunit [Nitrospirales bacterium]